MRGSGSHSFHMEATWASSGGKSVYSDSKIAPSIFRTRRDDDDDDRIGKHAGGQNVPFSTPII